MPKELEEELKKRAMKLAKQGKLKSMHIHLEADNDDEDKSIGDSLQKAKDNYIYGTMMSIKKRHGQKVGE